MAFTFQNVKIPKSSKSKKAVKKYAPILKKEFKKKGLEWGSNIYFRIFKEEKQLEVWAKKGSKFVLFKSYPICYFSGGLGTKTKQGDGKSPEGFYYLKTKSLNPYSSYHLSFNIGYPNKYERQKKYTGSALMVHGECVSIGCYAMGNKNIEEIYTPFPVHGLDKAMGLEPTRIAITAFIYGLIGLTVAIVMMNFIMIEDWPQNIGGKPSFSYIENMPAFVPIMFELTVFFAAHLMVITFYLRSRMWPFKNAENPDPRTTDDHFLMEIAVHGNENELETLLAETGAVEINIIDKEDGH